jgi:quercetin dioxygenase-like cupin family protein
MLNNEVIGPGAAFRFPPGTVHRLTAVEDTTIVEVSTPQLDDVVRLEDRYGRAGE